MLITPFLSPINAQPLVPSAFHVGVRRPRRSGRRAAPSAAIALTPARLALFPTR